MAEVIGLAASIASLLEIAGKITQLRAIQESEAAGLLPYRPPSLNHEVLKDCLGHPPALHVDLDKRLRRLLWPFQEKELKKYIDVLHRLRSIFADFLSSNILFVTNATYKKIATIDQEQARHQLLSWFPASDVFSRSRPTACPGTGQWFLNCQTVESWRSGSPSLLWCYGAPGVGKSLLASITIDHLLGKRAEHHSVVYFFCDFSSREQQGIVLILQCLLRQLIEQADDGVISALKALCSHPPRLQNLEELARIFTAACALRPTYLIIDAPDELNEPDGLLSYLPSFVQAGCRVLVTSRDFSNIRKKLNTANKMEVESDVHDLQTYIEARFQASEFSSEPINGNGLVQEIAAKASKTFLHTKLILDELLDLTTVRQMRKALESFPSGLNEAYESSLKRIDSQPRAKRDLARRMIAWIAYARRPLRMNEMLCAFAVEEESDDVHPDNFPNPDLLLRLCMGLIIVDDKDGTVRMVHTTAYDFFRSRLLSAEEAEVDIAGTCLQYLCLRPFKTGACKASKDLSRRFQEMAFLGYSARYWGQHLKGKESAERHLEKKILELLSDENLRASAFQALHYREEFKNELLDAFFESVPTGQAALHVAAYWNLVHTVERLIQQGVDVSPLDSQEWTPLHYACSNGHFAAAEILVRNGAEIDRPDSQGWTPLFWAAFSGSLDIVRLYLKNGADYLCRSALGWTALHWAISRGESAIVKELLEHHQTRSSLASEADIRALGLQKASSHAGQGVLPPVRMAADAENPVIFDLLVTHLHTSGSKIGDPAFNEIWAREGFDAPVSNPWRTLTKGELINGVESELPDVSRGWSWQKNRRTDPVKWKNALLQSAIRDSQFTAAQLLIQTGADVNFCSRFGTALHVATCRKELRYVQLLLQNSADPHVTAKGRTPLHQAVMCGFLETTEALIDGGAMSTSGSKVPDTRVQNR